MLTRMQRQTGHSDRSGSRPNTMHATMLDSLAARRSAPFGGNARYAGLVHLS